ncbi:MAG: tail protein X [Planctomycetota bacterium]
MSISYSTIAGDTFDLVARKTYGDDRKANIIRKANPGVTEPMAAGLLLKIPSIPGVPDVLRGRIIGK